MKYTHIFVLILLLAQFAGFSQPKNAKADSLSRLIAATTKDDSVKVNLLIEYARCVIKVDNGLALDNFKLAESISSKIGFTNGIIKGLNGEGSCYWIQNKKDQCISTFQKALKLAQKANNSDLQIVISGNLGAYYGLIGISDSAEKYQKLSVIKARILNDPRRSAGALKGLGLVYYNKGNYFDAIQCYLEAKDLFKKCNNDEGLVGINIQIGMIYYDLHNFNKSIAAYREARIKNKKLNNVFNEMTLLQNMGLSYAELKKDKDSARILINKALLMSRENKLFDGELSCLTNLGNIAYDDKNYKLAIQLFEEVYNSPLINSRNKIKAGILINLGTSYLNTGDLKRAEKYALEGLKLAEEQKFVAYEQVACKTLANILTEKKSYKEACDFFIRFNLRNETIEDDEVNQKVAEAVFDNSLKQKENENLLLLKENELKLKIIQTQKYYIFFSSAILILGILLFFVIIRNNRRINGMNQILDQKNKELTSLNATKDKLYSVIAHDLKAPFNSLLGLLVELDENFDDFEKPAIRRILSNLRKSSQNTYNLLVNLLDWTQSQRKQIEYRPSTISVKNIIKEVMAVLSTRSDAKKQNLIDETDNELSIFSDPQIIKSILLNLVNNAIKFTADSGTITIRSQFTEKFLRIEVIDSGIGIPPSQISKLFRIDSNYQRYGTANEPGTGLGLAMCKEFITILGGEIGVQSDPESGSQFYFTIPVSRSTNLPE